MPKPMPTSPSAAPLPGQTGGPAGDGRATYPAPVLRFNPDIAVAEYRRLRAALHGVDLHFAVKCQPHPDLLAALMAAGSGFEVASMSEISTLVALGVDPGQLVFSNPVKAAAEVQAAYAAGVRLFAMDSTGEIDKLATNAPGGQVMVRLATRSAGAVASEGKFGVDPVTAATLLAASEEAGLDPVGIAFHVGSQCLDPSSWTRAIAQVCEVMTILDPRIRIRLLDIGGGFPARYACDPPPQAFVYGNAIRGALARLPYRPERVIAEPGRAIAAPAGVLVADVIGVARRRGKRVAHLTVGAMHGVIESLESRVETGQPLPWPVWDSRNDLRRKARWDLEGPSCDSLDTVARNVLLSPDLQVGDQVMLGCAGAYTTCYVDDFMGLPAPTVHTVGGRLATGVRTPDPDGDTFTVPDVTRSVTGSLERTGSPA